MAVSANALTTTANFKTAHGVSGSGDDTLIEKIIDRASDWIEQKTNRKLKARRYNNGGSTHATTAVADEDYIYFSGTRKRDGGNTIADERGFGRFYLPQWPVQANSVLTFALDTLDDRDSSGGETWDTTTLVEFDDFIVNREEGYIQLLGASFARGYRNYRVTMAAGYQAGAAQPYVPDDLEQLCIDIGGMIYHEKRNVQSEKIGTWSRVFDTSKDDPLIAGTLEKYTRTIL